MSDIERVVVRLDLHISSQPLVYSCISPHTRPLPHTLPTRERLISKDLPDPALARQLNWSHNDFPALALTQKQSLFQGFLFQRLAVTEQTIPAVKVGENWELENNFRSTWCNLENGLRATITSLWFAHKHVGSGRTSTSWLGPEGSLFHRPESYGYTRAWPSRSELIAHTLRSRDAFLPLMAMCTLAMITLTPDGQELIPPDSAPAWRTALHRGHQGFSEQYVDLIARSPVTDLVQFDRAGLILDAHTCTFIDAALAMASRGLLVWVCWGTFDNPYRGSILHHQLPSRRSVEEALRRFKEMQKLHPTNLIVDQPHLPIENSPSVRSFPHPAPGSRQLRGETWQRFFARMEKHDAARAKSETDLNRQSRLSREKAQSNHQCPGRRGPVVFEWLEVDGFLMRTSVDRHLVSDVWTDYNVQTRKYNSFDNEWDLCSGLAVSKEQLRPDYIDEVNEEEDDSLPTMKIAKVTNTNTSSANAQSIFKSIPIPPREPVDIEIPSSCYQHELDCFFGLVRPSEPAIIEDGNNLNAMLEYRYGMHVATPYRRAVVQGLPKRLLPLLKASMVLLDANSPTASNRDAIVDFVSSLDARGQYLRAVRNENRQERPPQPFEVPYQLHDLCQKNPFYLSRSRSCSVSSVTMIAAHGTSYYKLLPIIAAPTESWHIFVASATTAVECLRRDWKTQREIATAFLERGTAFSTGITFIKDFLSTPLRKPRICWRSSEFKATLHDYAEYEIMRDALLNEPRGRSALMTGGIIWRLAKEIISPDVVLCGPSSQRCYGKHLEFPREGVIIYDDMLSELEMDVISGVYCIYTGIPRCSLAYRAYQLHLTGHGDQVALTSWWPRHETWSQSGMDVGYWAPFCEKWFQKRLRGIRDGTEHPRSTTEWKQALVFNKATNRVKEAVEEASARFLTDLHM